MITDRQSSPENRTDLNVLKHADELRPPEPSELHRCDEDQPESDRMETQEKPRDISDGSLADDEDDGEQLQDAWCPEKDVQAFTPNVMIVQPTGLEDVQKHIEMEKIPLYVHSFHTNPPEHFHPPWIDDIDKPQNSCVDAVRLCVCVAAAAVFFPLLTWGGYKLLPFDAPPLDSSALRLIYTLRCAFFASIPIVLGVLVQGVSRLRFGTLKPLFDGTWENREVVVHYYFVRDSLHLYLLYFLQLAVMATYTQEMLKLVPLLTIIFVLGRLIYWVCVVFGSSVRAFGFALSFLPLLVLLGVNLYFIGSVRGQEALFNVAPPPTAPPPKQRWWG
ncbi:transmembrane protein 79 [Carassius carassius]|uniref:transmembrane protein 79 n=1 Tax=Carassius carassius TaxID=217509 RepID=UPI002868BC66|nr:transmembrane protein 79 [Carassius carassius]